MSDKSAIKTELHELKIYNLFGEIDIVIPFSESKVKILISENGLGKTTLLKILYSVLTGRFYKLDSINFDKICMSFYDDEVIINKSDIYYDNILDDLSVEFKKIQEKLTDKNFKILLDIARTLPLEELKDTPLLRYTAQVIGGVPRVYLAELLKKYKFNLNDALNNINEKIVKCFSSEVLYLPTFRRIEEDFRELGLSSFDLLKLDETVRSGMQDIQDKIVKVISEIRDALYRRLASDEQWFYELASNLNIFDDSRSSDIDYLSDLLKHIAELISQDGINSIIEKIDVQKLTFIREENVIEDKLDILKEKLLGIKKTYEYQQDKLKNINNFLETCNKYLIGKKIEYDEVQAKVKITKDNGTFLESLDQLSSGEKHIVSLFARLYFDFNDFCFVIMDEPENSMSLEWQRMLLPDILGTHKCSYLLAATHSPFIFDNDLNTYAVALNEYIKD